MKRFIASMVSAVLLLSAVIAPLSVKADATGEAAQTQPVYAAAPQIECAYYSAINLVAYPGYEYRINGGSWQDSWAFGNLQPDTEYTFEQRHKATGAISEKVVFKTQHRGPSAFLHNELLLDYIDTNGTEIEGAKVLAYVMQDEYGADYYFVLGEEKGRPSFGLVYDGTEESNLVFEIYFDLDVTTEHIDVNYEFLLVDGDQILDSVSDYKRVDRDLYRDEYDFQNRSSGNYLPADSVNELLNLGFDMLIEFWDYELYEALGFGFKGLGFSYYYPGLGEVACDVMTSYHTGNVETCYQREPGCEVTGSYGYAVCSACGEHAYYYGSIPAKGAHTYDNACDEDCNDCGVFRRVTHSYAHDCSTVCDVCGAKRENPAAEHTWDSKRLCTVCGEQGRLPGDVNGDGKVNTGDVAKVYSHSRGTVLLTDPEALAAADVNADGKINMGDTARIFSHVKGNSTL